jgi:hypothetical protein
MQTSIFSRDFQLPWLITGGPTFLELKPPVVEGKHHPSYHIAFTLQIAI